MPDGISGSELSLRFDPDTVGEPQEKSATPHARAVYLKSETKFDVPLVRVHKADRP
jgi:hypothetical protein